MSYERVRLLNDGIEIQYLEHSIKVTKVPKLVHAAYEFLPLGATLTRIAWWAENRELFDLNKIVNIQMIRHIHVMWDVDEHLALNMFLFFLPGLGEPPIPIPHPAEIPPMAEPGTEQMRRDISEFGDDDEHQDLDEIDEGGGQS